MKTLVILIVAALNFMGILPEDFTAQDVVATEQISITETGVLFTFEDGTGYYIEYAEEPENQ